MTDLPNALKFKTPQNDLSRLDPKVLQKHLAALRSGFYLAGDYYQDSTNKNVLEALILYLCQHPDFETLDIPERRNTLRLGKGLYLFGNPGSGKTDLFRLLDLVALGYSQLYNYRKLKFKTVRSGHFVADYGVAVKAGTLQDWYAPNLVGVLYIDDLGVETKYFGEELLSQLILDRYAGWKSNPSRRTYISSNLKISEIAARYGERIADRIVEMCNVLELPGPSRRK